MSKNGSAGWDDDRKIGESLFSSSEDKTFTQQVRPKTPGMKCNEAPTLK